MELEKKSYYVIGLMSGSSLDGLDIAYCRFDWDNGWKFEVIDAVTIKHTEKWKERITKLVLQNAINYLKTDIYFGQYLGELVKEFVDQRGIQDQVDFVVSHGQSIFHQPENKLSTQLGHGAPLAAACNLPVITDLRSMDVSLGGQGAPIVPIGERHLFSEHKYFLNIGGIANISAHLENKVVAFDLCAANSALNYLAAELKLEYDDGGKLASQGSVSPLLFDSLNGSIYFTKEYPKSLSGGWVSKVFLPVLKKSRIPLNDRLRTVCEHIAYQIKSGLDMICEQEKIKISMGEKLVVSGGGALNEFLIDVIRERVPLDIVVPDPQIVNYKEAIIMAFLGVLRVRGEVNVLSSVTGASTDSINGAIYAAPKRVYP